jgi:Tol biopolymer transport system component
MANSDGSKLQRLTIDKSKDFMPAFSPDNKSIVFSSSRTGAFYLYKMDLKSRKISPLTGVKNTKLKWVLTEINSKRLSDHSALYYMFDSTGK